MNAIRAEFKDGPQHHPKFYTRAQTLFSFSYLLAAPANILVEHLSALFEQYRRRYFHSAVGDVMLI